MKLYNTEQASRLLGVDGRTIKRWLASGKLRGSQPSGKGGKWVIREDDISAMLDATNNQPKPKKGKK